MQIEWLAQLPGYDEYKDRILSILSKYKEKGVGGEYDADLHLALARLKTPLENTSAKHAYNALCYMYHNVIKNADSVALKLLDSCPISSEPFLKYEGDDEGYMDFRVRLGPEEVVQRLSTNYIHLDSTGEVYYHPHLLAIGSESVVFPGRNVTNVQFNNAHGMVDALIDYGLFLQSIKLGSYVFTHLDSTFFERNVVLNVRFSAWLSSARGVDLLNSWGVDFVDHNAALLSQETPDNCPRLQALFHLNPLLTFIVPYVTLDYLNQHSEELNKALVDKSLWKLFLDEDNNTFRTGILRYMAVSSVDSRPGLALMNLFNEHSLFVILVSTFNIENHKKIWSFQSMGGLKDQVDLFIKSLADIDSIQLPYYKEIYKSDFLNDKNKIYAYIDDLIVFAGNIYDPLYIVKFIETHGDHKKERIDKYIKAHCESRGKMAWLESLSLSDAEYVMDLFIKYEMEFDKAEIYNSSEKLKNTKIILEYAHNLKSHGSSVANGQQAFLDSDESIYQVGSESYADEIKAVVEATYAYRTVTMQAISALTDYAKLNMQQLPDGSFKSLRLVPKVRARALEYLFDIVAQDDAHWNGFNRTINSAAFKEMAGFYNTNKSTSGYFTPYSLWPIVDDIKTAIEKQAHFYQQFSDRKLLVKVMQSDQAFKALSTKDLSYIYAVSDKDVFINSVVRFERLFSWKPIQVLDSVNRVRSLTVNDIVVMTDYAQANLDETNKLRKAFDIKQCVPNNYMLPGISEDTESLPKELLYQFEESDMANADIFITKTYENSLLNFLNGLPRSENKAKQLFLYIPTAMFPIISDPDVQNNFRRPFENFSRQLRSIVNSAPSAANAIFCGVLNVSGTHYVPYFIYKNVAQKIFVITVDPSPQLSKWEGDTTCPKFSGHELLKKCFNYIFHDCEFLDPNITQQLRQRDCGPNALTVVEDALKTGDAEFPLIGIADQKLVINTDMLSVNCNRKRMYDFVKKTYLYSVDAVQASNENRRIWSRRLVDFKSQVYVQPDLAPNNDLVDFKTAFNFYDSELSYDYLANVNSQSHSDDLSVIRDQVATAIIETGGFGDDIDAIKRRFVDSFALPGQETVGVYVNRIKAMYPGVIQEVENAHLDIHQVLISIFEQNVKESYSDAIVNYFSQFMSQYKLADPAEELGVMINTYLSGSKASQYYIKLSPDEKKSVYRRLLDQASRVFSEKKYNYNLQMTEEAVDLHLKGVLETSYDLAANRDKPIQFQAAIIFNDLLRKDDKYRTSILYISKIHSKKLFEMIEKKSKAIVLRVSEETKNYLKASIDGFASLEAFTGLNGPIQPDLFSPAVIALLQAEDPFVLRHNQFMILGGDASSASSSSAAPVNQVYSYLVSEVHQEINRDVKRMINDKIVSFIADGVREVVLNSNPLNGLSSDAVTAFANNPAELKAFSDHSIASIPALRALCEQFESGSFFARAASVFVFEQLSEEVRVVSEFIPDQLATHKNYYNYMQAVLDSLRDYMNLTDQDVLQDNYLELSRVMAGFTAFQHSIVACSKYPINEARVVLRNINNAMTKTLKDFMQTMLQVYEHSDLNFNHITPRFRVLLAYGLNFNSWNADLARLQGVPGYLHSNVTLLDNMIIEKIENMPSGHRIADKPYRVPCLVAPSASMPATYGKKITVKLLVELLTFCMKEMLAKGVSSEDVYKNPFIVCLLNGLEVAPLQMKDDEPLDTLFVTNLYNDMRFNPRVRAEIQNNIICLKVYQAIIHSENFSSAEKQKVGQDARPVLFSDIKSILSMHTKSKDSAAISEYLDESQYPLAVSKAPKADLFQAGFWSRKVKYSDDMKILMTVLDKMQFRRQLDGTEDFALDKTDLDVLANLLKERWATVEKNNPFIYHTFEHSIDRVFLVLAIALKRGYKNLDIAVSAYQLLMPGTIKSAVVELCDYARDVLRQEDHIDSYNYSDIITLPDLTWISAVQLVDNYQRVSKLSDQLTGKLLTDVSVAHIIKHCPHVTKQLVEAFSGLHSTGITDKTKKALLEYLQNSVFSEGFSGYYGSAHDQQAQNAHKKLGEYISSLSELERDLLLGLKVPASSNTLGQTLSQGGHCITSVGLAVAKILYYNCPEITLEMLGSGLSHRYHEIQAVGRTSSVSKTIDTEMYANEIPLMRVFMGKYHPGLAIPDIKIKPDEPVQEAASLPVSASSIPASRPAR